MNLTRLHSHANANLDTLGNRINRIAGLHIFDRRANFFAFSWLEERLRCKTDISIVRRVPGTCRTTRHPAFHSAAFHPSVAITSFGTSHSHSHTAAVPARRSTRIELSGISIGMPSHPNPLDLFDNRLKILFGIFVGGLDDLHDITQKPHVFLRVIDIKN